MTKLERMQSALAKRKAELSAKYKVHFEDVRAANGQPLNDKRNGASTKSRWDKQRDSIRKLEAGMADLEARILEECQTIAHVDRTLDNLPEPIRKRVESGELEQWRKHPDTFFVPDVDKARIQWADGKLYHKYARTLAGEQRIKFARMFNGLKKEIGV